MKLEVGMYVRTKITDNCNYVYIRKIDEIETEVEKAYRNQICIDEDVIDGWGDDRIWIDIEDISKASNNIIDLIEVGDYVNGLLVIDKYYDYANKEWRLNDRDGLICIENNIKSIVTKEQFESIKYSLEGECENRRNNKIME